MPQKTPIDDIGAGSEPLYLLRLWLNGGRTPLSILKGYSDLFLKGGFGGLNSKQQEVMRKISQLTGEAVDHWNEFAEFFHLSSTDDQPISPAEIGPEEFTLLQEKIIDPALAALQKIRDNVDALLQEKCGTIEQRESLNALRQNCLFAIQGWYKPLEYFNKQ